MTPQSSKAKGRRFQQEIRDIIIQTTGINPGDILSRGMGQQGTDIYLSTPARNKFPFAVECKNTERLSIWEAIRQTETNAAKESLIPMLAFRRNRHKPYIAIPADEFFKLWSMHLIDVAYAKRRGQAESSIDEH